MAALMIVFFHWASEYAGLKYHAVGLVTGIDLFFVLSGFVMIYTTARRPLGMWAFFINRVVRIVPLYWALTMAVFLGALVAPRIFQSTRGDSVELLKSLLFIPYLKGSGLFRPVLHPGWTLNLEMFFYGLFAVSLIVRSGAWRLALVIGALFSLVGLGAVLQPQGGLLAFYSQPVILDFGAGMVLGVIFPRLAQLQVSRILCYVGLVVTAIAMVAARQLLPDPQAAIPIGLSATLFVLFVLLAEVRGVVVRSPFLLLIGAASYSLYLTHIFVVLALQKIVAKLGADQGMLLPISAIAIAAVSVGVGIMVHLWFERPVDTALRTLLRYRRSDPVGNSLALWPWRRA